MYDIQFWKCNWLTDKNADAAFFADDWKSVCHVQSPWTGGRISPSFTSAPLPHGLPVYDWCPGIVAMSLITDPIGKRTDIGILPVRPLEIYLQIKEYSLLTGLRAVVKLISTSFIPNASWITPYKCIYPILTTCQNLLTCQSLHLPQHECDFLLAYIRYCIILIANIGVFVRVYFARL